MRRYYHGPTAGIRPTDKLSRPVKEMIPRANLAGPVGWCCLCTKKDVPAVTTGWWTDPDDGRQFEIAVCHAHGGRVRNAP